MVSCKHYPGRSRRAAQPAPAQKWTPLTTFPQFSKLPKEVQLMIWAFAEFPTRIVDLCSFSQRFQVSKLTPQQRDELDHELDVAMPPPWVSTTRYFATQNLFPLLSTCQASREMGLKSCTLSLRTRNKRDLDFAHIQKHINRKTGKEVDLHGKHFIAPTHWAKPSYSQVYFNPTADIFYLSTLNRQLGNWETSTQYERYLTRCFSIPQMEKSLGTTFVHSIQYLAITGYQWNATHHYLLVTHQTPGGRQTFLHLPGLKRIYIVARPTVAAASNRKSAADMKEFYKGRVAKDLEKIESWMPGWKAPEWAVVDTKGELKF